MNRIARTGRARILHLLCEGNSIRAVTRLTGVSKTTVTKLVVGGRNARVALDFTDDLAERLAGRVQFTSDGLRLYVEAVAMSFGHDVDFAQLVKIYGEEPGAGPERKYSPGECIGARKERIEGNPDMRHVSTSFAERNNLNIKMHSRRMTRLTNGFSKKVANHAHAMALHFLYYNFVRTHQTLRMSPAMAAGVTKRLWEMSDVVTMLEAWEAVQSRVST